MERVMSMMALYSLWVLVPMIPAIAIYSRFPDRIVASGVLAGLNVKAGGAFAAYLIIFLVALPLINKIEAVLDQELQIWTIEGPIKLEDEKGTEIRNSLLRDKVSVELSPRQYDISQKTFRIRLVVTNNELPYVTIRVPDYSDGDVPITGTKDYLNHMIEYSAPVEIRKNSTLQPPHPFGP